MFGKNKQLEEMNEKLGQMNSVLKANEEVVDKLRIKIEEFDKQFNLSREYYKYGIQEFSGHLEKIKAARESFESELKDVKNLKRAIEVNLLNEIKSSLNEKFSEALHRLNTYIGNYQELDAKSAAIKQQLSSLESEIKKFQNISSSIKEKDFALENFAKQLLSLDQEKLALMRKIDTLERLISQQRRATSR